MYNSIDRHGAEPRNQHHHTVVLAEIAVFDRREHAFGHRGGRFDRDDLNARFAMMTDAQLHLASGDLEVRFAHGRNGAG